MKRKKTKPGTLLSILLAALTMLYIILFLMMVLGSFKSQTETAKFDLSLPSKWLFSDYAHMMELGKVLSGYINNVIIITPAIFVSLVLGTLAGIMISKRNGRTCEGLYCYSIFGLTLTLQIASIFSLLKAFRIYETFFSVICVFISLRIPFTVVTFSSFVKGVPKGIDETAMIDGRSSGRMVSYILPPVLKPIAVTNITITAIDVWNNFTIPLFYLGSAEKATVTMAIYNFFGRYNRDWQYVFGALSPAVPPVLMLFMILQKHIAAGMTSGTVRG